MGLAMSWGLAFQDSQSMPSFLLITEKISRFLTVGCCCSSKGKSMRAIQPGRCFLWPTI